MSKALVVDDSRAVRMVLSRTLRELGFEVLQAADGREALELMSRERPAVDLALVDWNMPEMNGLELVRRLRAEPRYEAVRLMMVTTETEMEQIVLALEAGANEYMMKPFTREAVEDKLRLLGVIP
jgi:two-component system chemotaxis response regulator CheY